MNKHKNGTPGVTVEFPKDLADLNNCIDYINSAKCQTIIISANNAKEPVSLNFLNDVEHPEEVAHIAVNCNYYLKDVEALYRFSELTQFSFETNGKQIIDLSHFQKLETFSTGILASFTNLDVPPVKKFCYMGTHYGGAHKKCEPEKLAMLHGVEDLRLLFGVKGFEFSHAAELKHLRRLMLLNNKIPDLAGIENLTELEALHFDQCTALTDIGGIDTLAKLQYLEFVSCGKIENLSEVAKLKKLKTLAFENMRTYKFDFLKDTKSKKTLQCLSLLSCGSIDSISFLNQCPKLKAFCGFRTNIMDGDLTPLQRCEYAWVNPRKHYNLNAEELPVQGHKLTDYWD